METILVSVHVRVMLDGIDFMKFLSGFRMGVRSIKLCDLVFARQSRLEQDSGIQLELISLTLYLELHMRGE